VQRRQKLQLQNRGLGAKARKKKEILVHFSKGIFKGKSAAASPKLKKTTDRSPSQH